MTTALSTNDLRKTLNFPFASPNSFTTVLIGSALLFANGFIPFIPGILVYGYFVRLMRNAIQGAPPALPGWTDWEKLAKDGLRSFAVACVYMGPGFVVLVGGWFTYFALMIGGPMLMEFSPRATSLPVLRLLPLMMMGSMVVMLGSMFLGSFLMVLGALPLPVALAHFIARDQVRAAFDLRTLAKIVRADPWGYLLSWVIVVGLLGVMYVAFLLFYFTIVFCFVGYLLIIPLGFYCLAVGATLFGNYYREGMPPPQAPAAATPANPEPAVVTNSVEPSTSAPQSAAAPPAGAEKWADLDQA